MPGKGKSFSDFGTQNFKEHKPAASLPERESSIEKASASDVFSNVLAPRKEKKTERLQILLTETNRKILDKHSDKTGRSRNDIINELISSLEKLTGL